ncbi:hypothetical protein WT60_10125 [Burkholderia sp. MSMB617WGS]|uniref:Uncharacterized protein n=1 Tax=Burkholderia savannae TaxID=1637837 RepID=A0ABR5TDU1_9BURK|nr:hypothetical protein WT60_10125 [Burkholderia sp. MSMB617WGS]KWZ43164.1 hypothetical protein WS72_10010 [Burkholderia savannae]
MRAFAAARSARVVPSSCADSTRGLRAKCAERIAAAGWPAFDHSTIRPHARRRRARRPAHAARFDCADPASRFRSAPGPHSRWPLAHRAAPYRAVGRFSGRFLRTNP